MSRTGRNALAALVVLAAAGAHAQWRNDPMPVRLAAPASVLVGNYSTGTGDDLLIVFQGAAGAEVRPFHALLRSEASAFAPLSLGEPRVLRGGYLAQNGSDDRADVARVGASGGAVEIAFGNAPASIQQYLVQGPYFGEAAAFLHLLPRTADVLVVPDNPGEIVPERGVIALDFSPAPVPTVAERTPTLRIVPFHLNYLAPPRGFEAVPLRASRVARENGLDDIALPGAGGLVLLVHEAVPAPPTLDSLQLSTIEVGGNGGGTYEPPWFGTRSPWLPATIPGPGETLGVAMADVDLDGDLDLVFAQTLLFPDAFGDPTQGAIVWVEGSATGDPAAFSNSASPRWHDLGFEYGLGKPLSVWQVERAGAPAAAIWDYDAQELVVIGGAGGPWRGPAPGAFARDVRAADVVGSPAKDLVAVMENGTAPGVVLVYPDLGLPSPRLSWAPGSPGVRLRGVPHRLAVLLDPSGPVTVEWVEGAPTTAPLAQGIRLLEHEFAADCTLPPKPLAVTVRATDDTGVFDELRATTPIGALPLAIALLGGSAPGRLFLDPGGVTTAVFDGTAATGCGDASWLDAWPAGVTLVDDPPRPAGLRRTAVIPAAAYAALLADPQFVVSLGTTDPSASPAAIGLALELDGSGLVEVIHAADRTALADGEVAVLRTTLRSRIAVALPLVRVVDALSGLVPAGPPAVSGASIASVSADGADLVLDVLPAAPAEVTIALPVRGTGGRGASGVEARSTGGWLLTPPASAGGDRAPLPGCGCGAGSAPGALALLALALVARRRRAT